MKCFSFMTCDITIRLIFVLFRTEQVYFWRGTGGACMLILTGVTLFSYSHFVPLNIVQILPSATKMRQGNVFTPVCQSFCSQGEGVCLSACWDTPPWAGTLPWVGTAPRQVHTLASTPLPPAGTPPGQVHPPGRYILLGRHTPQAGALPGQVHPWAGTPPGQAHTPGQVHPLGRHTPLGRYTPPDGHCSGRYESYWNAFLFKY